MGWASLRSRHVGRITEPTVTRVHFEWRILHVLFNQHLAVRGPRHVWVLRPLIGFWNYSGQTSLMFLGIVIPRILPPEIHTLIYGDFVEVADVTFFHSDEQQTVCLFSMTSLRPVQIIMDDCCTTV